jgi:hypothetical protein
MLFCCSSVEETGSAISPAGGGGGGGGGISAIIGEEVGFASGVIPDSVKIVVSSAKVDSEFSLPDERTIKIIDRIGKTNNIFRFEIVEVGSLVIIIIRFLIREGLEKQFVSLYIFDLKT